MLELLRPTLCSRPSASNITNKEPQWRLGITLRISEDELVRDARAVLDKVERGNEVIIERDHRCVAMMKLPQPVGHKLSECIKLTKAYYVNLGYAPISDADFAKDVQEVVDSRRRRLLL